MQALELGPTASRRMELVIYKDCNSFGFHLQIAKDQIYRKPLPDQPPRTDAHDPDTPAGAGKDGS